MDLHAQHGELGFSHLAGHGALPDQLIEGQVLAIEACLVGGSEAFPRGANRLVGLLGVAGLGGELARTWAQVVLAIHRGHAVAGRIDGLVGEVHRIGAHVGDEAPLVEALGRAHGVAGREPQLAVGLLLQGAGGEGGHGLAHRGFGLHFGHPPGGSAGGRLEAAGFGFAKQLDLAAGFQLTGGLIEIGAPSNALALEMTEFGFKAGAFVLELGLEIPVAATAEGAPGPLTQHQQPHGHRLNPAGREAPSHLLPKQRREGVTHQPIQDSPGLLGVHQLHVELAGLVEGPANRLLGDLVEHHALDRHLRA